MGRPPGDEHSADVSGGASEPPVDATPEEEAMGTEAAAIPVRWNERIPRSVWIALLLLFLAVLLLVVLLSQYSRYRVLSGVSGVKRDMRMMATAIEAYYVDNMSYPTMTRVRALMIENAGWPDRAPLGYTLRRYTGYHGPLTLTTPIAYLTGYPMDRFAEPYRVPYLYYVEGASRGWILASFGPDADLMEGGDLGFDNGTVERVYDPMVKQPSNKLLTGSGPRGAYTYDPTNGLLSNGDIWRVKM